MILIFFYIVFKRSSDLKTIKFKRGSNNGFYHNERISKHCSHATKSLLLGHPASCPLILHSTHKLATSLLTWAVLSTSAQWSGQCCQGSHSGQQELLKRLHQDDQLPVDCAHLALHCLPLQEERSD